MSRRRQALVEFHHGRGCDLGMPYGSCSADCGYEVVEFLTEATPWFPTYDTAYAALKAGNVMGHNLRCSQCGSWGATWHSDGNPRSNRLALCPKHAFELNQEMRRHEKAMTKIRTRNFHQDNVEYQRAWADWRKDSRAKRKAEEEALRALRRTEREAKRAAKQQETERKKEAESIPWQA